MDERQLQPISTRELAERLIAEARGGTVEKMEITRLLVWGRELRLIRYQYRITPLKRGQSRARLIGLATGGSSTTPATDIAALCRTLGEVVMLALAGYANELRVTNIAGAEQGYERIGEQWYEVLVEQAEGA